MTRGYVPLMLLIALIWGASYLFIKVAVEEMSPAVMSYCGSCWRLRFSSATWAHGRDTRAPGERCARRGGTA